MSALQMQETRGMSPESVNPESVNPKAVSPETVNSETTHRSQALQNAERDLLNLLLPLDQAQVSLTNDEAVWKVEAIETAKAKVPYPIDLATGEDWFSEIGANPLLDQFTASEIGDRATQFFSHLDQLWEPDLVAVLSRKFVTVPGELLKAIAVRATKIASASGDLADQLIACAQESLPQWGEDDLRVFARPLAYAMRGDAPKQDAPAKDWNSLSEIEQAKLTLAIAKYALDHQQS
jgi:hypothetical protein